jgi:hypothetical protein
MLHQHGDKEVQASLFGSHFGDVDMKETDGIALELGPLRLVTFGFGKSADAVALQTAVQ